MDKLFQIGDFVFRLCCSDEIVPPPNFMLFEAEEGEAEYVYQITVSEELPSAEGNVIARRPDLAVYQSGKGEARMLGVRGIAGFYAYYQEVSEKKAEIVLLRSRLRGLHIDPFFTSLLALERRMLLKNSLILHCAYLCVQGAAVLFSGPSGIGKSTQAGLWEKYRNADIVNGDRALLQKRDGRWNACAWPVCGSSEICHLGNYPVHAIVMLKQGTENQARLLSPVQAFTQLYSQITLNGWNRAAMQQGVCLMEDIVDKIPVYQFTCTMTEPAVDCLEGELKKRITGIQ